MFKASTSDGLINHDVMRLFMYVSEAALTDILSEQRILISCPWRTNDATEAVARHMESRPKIVNEYGYICLSAICDSPAMWGYYANRSKGACLVFDFIIRSRGKWQHEILRNGMTNDLPLWIEEVRYKESRATAKTTDQIMGEIPNFELLATKSKDWEREREYRIFYYLSRVHATNIVVPPDKSLSEARYYDRDILRNLSGIILGVNSEVSEYALRALLAKVEHECVSNNKELFIPVKDLDIVRAKMHDSSFRYVVKQENIKIRQEQMVNEFLDKLMCSQWGKEWVHSAVEFLLNEDESARLIDRENTYTTRISAFSEREEFVITRLMKDLKTPNGEYALFEYVSGRGYRYVCNMKQEVLKAIYLHAQKSAQELENKFAVITSGVQKSVITTGVDS